MFHPLHLAILFQTAKKDLRWAVGTILAEGDEAVNEATLQAYLDKGYQRFDIPAVDAAVVANFPFKTVFSILLSIRLVYPKLRDFAHVS